MYYFMILKHAAPAPRNAYCFDMYMSKSAYETKVMRFELMQSGLARELFWLFRFKKWPEGVTPISKPSLANHFFKSALRIPSLLLRTRHPSTERSAAHVWRNWLLITFYSCKKTIRWSLSLFFKCPSMTGIRYRKTFWSLIYSLLTYFLFITFLNEL